jgi:hypothetical protein
MSETPLLYVTQRGTTIVNRSGKDYFASGDIQQPQAYPPMSFDSSFDDVNRYDSTSTGGAGQGTATPANPPGPKQVTWLFMGVLALAFVWSSGSVPF